MLRSFWCAMIAAMTLKMFDPFGSGKIVLFAVTYDKVSTRVIASLLARLSLATAVPVLCEVYACMANRDTDAGLALF